MSNLRDARGVTGPSGEQSTQAAAQRPSKPLHEQWRETRQFTESLCEPLATEDYVVQSMVEASPTKWHLAHTTWFFDRFILAEHIPDYQPINPQYFYLFNSYYNAAGPQFDRPRRGLLSRPTVEEVYAYRKAVDDRLADLLERAPDDQREALDQLLLLGIHHEQQHQELLITDIKHVLSINPLLPAYRKHPAVPHKDVQSIEWFPVDEGVYEIGWDGAGFCYDNETPRHNTYLHPFELASRLVTNGEYLDFLEDGGYQNPQYWLSLGWDTICKQQWSRPIYWYRDGTTWMQFTMAGPLPLDRNEPVCHLSYFEADAYARWADCHLPTEQEWEVAASDVPIAGPFAENGLFHPTGLNDHADSHNLKQMFGELWQWTASHYSPYPGYKPAPGALGEYNGKFMCNQFVLRGGSCATARTHVRRTYRNFFFPDARWQFTGLRLAKDA